MAWPFSTVIAPNLDSGPGVAIPTTPAAVTANPAWLMGAHFSNPTSAAITVTVTDAAGDVLIAAQIPGNSEPPPYEWPFRPTTGVKWSANAVGLLGHIWGYQ